jgi:hypothetical protein
MKELNLEDEQRGIGRILVFSQKRGKGCRIGQKLHQKIWIVKVGQIFSTIDVSIVADRYHMAEPNCIDR